ncbi:MAG: trigger factor [Myxococcota bacterium]
MSDANSDITATASQETPIRHRVEVQIGAARVRKAFDRAYRDLAKQARIKGFRPGKAPRSVLEKMYGPSVAEEIEHTLVRETLADAIEQTGLSPVATPAVDARTPSADADFQYTALVEVKPPIDLPELEGLPARRPPVDVGEDEVLAQLAQLQERNAPLVEEPDGTEAAQGHVLTIDFVGRIDGEPFEGGSGKGVELEIGTGRFIPGFEDQLVGARSGDDRTVEVTFPEDYGAEDLAGKQASFEVHVAEVKKRQIPDLDDEFAKDLGDFETLDALKDRIRQDLLESRENAAKAELRKSLLEALVERTDFEVPPGMTDQQLEHQLRQAVQRFQGQIPEEALREQVGRWREEWRPDAEREVREMLLLEAIAEDRSFSASDEEVEAHIETLAASQGATADQLRQALDADALEAMARRQVADDKVLEFLGAAAKVEETADT